MRDYVADHRQYGATGKVTGGGWCVMWWDGKREIWEEGTPHATKAQAMASMREEHQRSAAASLLGRKGRAVNSPAQQVSARENGKKGGRPPWRDLLDAGGAIVGAVCPSCWPSIDLTGYVASKHAPGDIVTCFRCGRRSRR